jgi:hypothetical protein
MVLSNAVMAPLHEYQRELLAQRFPDLVAVPTGDFLCLWKYLYRVPERFFDRDIYRNYLRWIRERGGAQHELLSKYLIENGDELDKAFRCVDEVNRDGLHDDDLETHRMERMRTVDRFFNPTYLKLVEGVFAPLAHLPAYFSRLDRGKNPDLLELYDIVEELRHSELRNIGKPYLPVVRNAIAHGGTDFYEDTIAYRDRKENTVTLSFYDVVRCLDDMLDTCNAMVLALSVFLLARRNDGYIIPPCLLLNELKEETRTPWWELSGSLELQLDALAQKKMLIAYGEARGRNANLIRMSAFQTAVLAERFVPGYEAYHVEIRFRSESLGGSISYGGMELRRLRESDNVRVGDYGPAATEFVLFPREFPIPRWLRNLRILGYVFRNYPFAAKHWNNRAGRLNVLVRSARLRKLGWRSRLDAKVVVSRVDPVGPKAEIRNNAGRILRLASAEARKNAGILRKLRLIPTGIVRIVVFQQDYRRRRLDCFGLAEDCVCVVSRDDPSPPLMQSIVECCGRFRISWNRAWLESTGNREEMERQ